MTRLPGTVDLGARAPSRALPPVSTDSAVRCSRSEYDPLPVVDPRRRPSDPLRHWRGATRELNFRTALLQWRGRTWSTRGSLRLAGENRPRTVRRTSPITETRCSWSVGLRSNSGTR
jgi:hypothetical protein